MKARFSILLLIILALGLCGFQHQTQIILSSPIVSSSGTFTCVQGGAGCTTTTAITCSAASATTATCTFGGNITAGNGVIMACSSFHQVTSVTGGGDTYTQDFSVVGPLANQYVNVYRVSSSSGGYAAVVAHAASNSYFSCGVIEVTHLSGLDTSATQSGNSGTGCTSPPSGTNCIVASSTTNPSSGTLAPSVGGDLFVGVSWNSNSAGALNWAGASALFDTNTNNVADIAYLIDAASASQQAVWTQGTTNSYIAAIVAYKHT